MLGDTVDLGDEVLRLTGIYEGAPDSPDLSRAPETARRLASQIKAASLPAAHNELAQQILEKLRAPKRFRPRSVMAEIELARKLAQRLIVSAGENLNPEALVDAFTHRSARLLQPDAIEEALSGAHTPVDQIERLFAMEDHLVGEENKKKLASYIRAKVTANTTVSYFVRGSGQPLERLSRVTSLQARAKKGGFPKTDKQELVDAFDSLGLAILDATKVMDRVAGSQAPVLDRAAALLKLSTTGVLPEGDAGPMRELRAVRMMESDEARVAAASPGGEARCWPCNSCSLSWPRRKPRARRRATRPPSAAGRRLSVDRDRPASGVGVLAQLVQIVPGIDAAVMAVVKAQAHGVAPHGIRRSDLHA